MPQERLRVTGHPLLEFYSELNITVDDSLEARKRLGLPPKGSLCFIASEILHYHTYYDKCRLVRKEYAGSMKGTVDAPLRQCVSLLNVDVEGVPLLKRLGDDRRYGKALFLARPHPNEALLSMDKVKIINWEDADDVTILSAVDVVFGLTAFILLESVTAGIPTVNVEPWLMDWIPENSYLRRELWEHLSGNGYLGDWRGVPASRPDNKGALDAVMNIIREAYEKWSN